VAKEQQLPQLDASLLANVNQQTEKRKELEQLEHDIAQQRLIFEQALHTLKSAVDEWKLKYLLVASASGKVAFDTFVQENQQMRNGQLLCFIKPENSTYYAEMHIPQYNFGKVRTGMTVLLKFPSYPFQEYGAVRGRVDFISHIPSDSGYLAKVVLSPGLVTNRGQAIQYRDGLQANAEILTDEKRLLMRLFYNTVGQLSR
jgi:HlyD family secretion protein